MTPDEPRCPRCGETRMIETVDQGFFCNVCAYLGPLVIALCPGGPASDPAEAGTLSPSCQETTARRDRPPGSG
jgi:hypothetical protein